MCVWEFESVFFKHKDYNLCHMCVVWSRLIIGGTIHLINNESYQSDPIDICDKLKLLQSQKVDNSNIIIVIVTFFSKFVPIHSILQNR